HGVGDSAAQRVLPGLREYTREIPGERQAFDQVPLAVVEPHLVAMWAVVEAIALFRADAVLAHERAALGTFLRGDRVGRVANRDCRGGDRQSIAAGVLAPRAIRRETHQGSETPPAAVRGEVLGEHRVHERGVSALWTLRHESVPA